MPPTNNKIKILAYVATAMVVSFFTILYTHNDDNKRIKLNEKLSLVRYEEWLKAGRVHSRGEFELLKSCLALDLHKRGTGEGHPPRWLGIPSFQSPLNNHLMQELITDLKPDYIIEAGTAQGGTTLFYAMVLEKINSKGKVITIDIDPQVEEASKFDVFKDKVIVLKGSSTSSEIISSVRGLISDGRMILITLDTEHKKDHVLNELRAYSGFVPKGGYIVVQGTAVCLGSEENGALAAVDEFLKENKNFVIDHDRERFVFSTYLSSFLKRVR